MGSAGLIQGGRWCQGKELKNLGAAGSEDDEGLGVGLEKSSEAWKACLAKKALKAITSSLGFLQGQGLEKDQHQTVARLWNVSSSAP